MSVDSVPVSVLSLTVPLPSAEKILLAVGKGSGALEVWTCDISSRKFHKIGLDDAYGHVVSSSSITVKYVSIYIYKYFISKKFEFSVSNYFTFSGNRNCMGI